MEERRERAYKVLIALSLASGLISSLLMSIVLPLLSQIIQTNNLRIETDAIICEDDTRLLISLLPAVSLNHSRQARSPREEEVCP